MKKTLIICILISIPILIYAFRSSYNTNYKIIKTVGPVEIRDYPKSLFASYYSKLSGDNSNFRVLEKLLLSWC